MIDMTECSGLLPEAERLFPYMVRVRRDLHEHPETGPLEQTYTLNYIKNELRDAGIPFVHIPFGGILACVGDKSKGPTLLMRADMDALPIEEDEMNLVSGKICVSKIPGHMHGCGHDAHTAMQLAEARILKKREDTLPGRIIFSFEEGEEGFEMIRQICLYLEDHQVHVDGCYGAHVRWDIPTGKAGACKGCAMAGGQHFDIQIHGAGGHGARPDLARSPVDAFCDVYSALRGVRMKYIDPTHTLTWSVGSIHAGTAHNVIPDDLRAEGSIRNSEIQDGDIFWNHFEEICRAVGEMDGCRIDLIRRDHLLPVVNHPASADLFERTTAAAIGLSGVMHPEPWMASDSFSFLTSMYPSVYAFIGIRNDSLGSGAPHHTGKFDIDEEAMKYGAAAGAAYAIGFLAEKPDTSDFRPYAGSMRELMNNI